MEKQGENNSAVMKSSLSGKIKMEGGEPMSDDDHLLERKGAINLAIRRVYHDL